MGLAVACSLGLLALWLYLWHEGRPLAAKLAQLQASASVRGPGHWGPRMQAMAQLLALHRLVLALLAAALAAFLIQWRRRRLRPALGIGTALRLLLYAGALALALYTWAAAVQWLASLEMLRGFLWLTLGTGCLAAWLLVLLLTPPAGARWGARHVRWLDWLLFNLCLLGLALEGGLILWAPHARSPLFWDDASVESSLRSFRRPAQEPYFNTRLNSGGYHDEEFFAARSNDVVVALLADSFGFGVVPYAYNFATVAEKRLQAADRLAERRVAIHNFGVPSIGMREYYHLLTCEVPQYRPQCVVLCLFVGNDIGGFRDVRGQSRDRRDLAQWWSWTLARRIYLMWAERQTTYAGQPAVGPVPPLYSEPDYIQDPDREPPTFSEERFLAIEAERLACCDPANARASYNYAKLWVTLDLVRAAVPRQAGFLLVLIPDEYQVNDDLYRALVRQQPAAQAWPRDYPQQCILAWCQREGVAVLDLLPVLREAESTGRTYHRRNTHWNARGNRLAGEALAQQILGVLAEKNLLQ